MKSSTKTVIVGGGLSGLTLAYYLSKRGTTPLVLEASGRLGGRVQTVNGALETPMELGATWFADKHTALSALISELGLEKFPQHSAGVSLFQTKSFEPPQKFLVPEAETPSYRIAGGTQKLTEALAQRLSSESIQLNTRVRAIRQSAENLMVEDADGGRIAADQVVICIPPQLVASTIDFSDELPSSIRALLPTVQTWMAGSIKFALEYKEPFWRKEGYSGMLYSHAGIIVEMYDYTDNEGAKFGFTGFLNGGAAAYSQEIRQRLVLQQLQDLFGEKALHPTVYVDKVWTDEYVLSGAPSFQQPHQNSGHPLLQEMYMNGRLLFCGTETATEFPGYMEGAVIAAKSVLEKL